MLTDNGCKPDAQPSTGSGYGQKILVSLLVLAFCAAAPVFAGGSSRGEAQTFGSYQTDFSCGPVGITIHGNSNLQVVAVSEQNVPSDIAVHYELRGGILHVTASYKGKPKKKLKPGQAGQITASMPRYEFVHIKTTSGAVAVDNLSTNHLTISTTTGKIHVINTNAALKVASTTGNQRYKQIYGAIDANSTTGNVSIDHSWGVVKLKSKSGSFDGKDINLAGNSTFHTASGSISVALTYGLSRYRYAFDLSSSSGKIKLGDIVRTGGKVRWGDGNIAIDATTGSGSQTFR